MPFVKRTRATFLNAEFGFFGVCVKTRTHTPRFCGLFCSAGLFVFVRTFSRPLRTNWLIVGTGTPSPKRTLRRRHPPLRCFASAGERPLQQVCCSRPRSRHAARHLELTYPIRFSRSCPVRADCVWYAALDRVS